MIEKPEFILSLTLLLTAALVGGFIFRRVGYPAALGELLIGSIIGPYALGLVGHVPIVVIFAELGAIVLLFYIGLEAELDQLLKHFLPALLVGICGAIIPFLLAYYAAIYLGYSFAEAVFLAVVLTATSVGITVRVLSDLGKLNTREGLVILGAGVVDDIIAIILVGLILELILIGGLSPLDVGVSIGKAAVFWVAVFLLGTRILCRAFDRVPDADMLFILLMIVCFAVATFSAGIGLSAIVGAFVIGVALSEMKKLHIVTSHLRGLYVFLVPIFFVSVGMLIDWRAFLGGGLVPGLIFTLLAILGKVLGCGGAAKLAGLSKIESLRVGVGMSPRGEMGLIVASMGLAGGFIGPEVYSISVIVVSLTTIVGLPLLKMLYGHNK